MNGNISMGARAQLESSPKKPAPVADPIEAEDEVLVTAGTQQIAADSTRRIFIELLTGRDFEWVLSSRHGPIKFALLKAVPPRCIDECQRSNQVAILQR